MGVFRDLILKALKFATIQIVLTTSRVKEGIAPERVASINITTNVSRSAKLHLICLLWTMNVVVVIMGMNMKTMGIGFVKAFAKMFVVTLEGLIALIYSFLIFKVLYFIMSSVEVGSASDAGSVVTTRATAGITAGGIMSAIMWLVFFFLIASAYDVFHDRACRIAD